MAWAKIRWEDKIIGVMSVHAPNKRERRMAFWRQMEGLLGEEKWVILGDFNNTEVPEDARGKSALVRGSEARFWRNMTMERGLVDCFFCTAVNTGTRFTRFAKRRGRMDCSRLDRIYLTQGAQWVDHVKEVVHHSSKSLSDHVPISVILQMVQEACRRKTESYFKMCYLDIQDPIVLNKDVRREKAKVRKQAGGLADELAWRRGHLSDNPTVEEVEALANLEKKVKDQEIHEVRVWRIRCREKWLTVEDAPSRYFFTKLRAKWAKEAIEALEVEDEIVSDQEEILATIH
ncbi:hypothetical protein R1sor_025584 [Riccia sorocarpa]|uniref:Endonuclease/exonuclease/phosphatase domain-containing protein n=1 Tax=Riccia sorocarpa TaxID=122646 RepID=A0ABD3GAD5_9MARC